MPITALSQTVVRALGSSQVLTTPVSLVKELVENALDAHASSIAVEISSNTLDCIQVKDNGHGIAPEDREDVAKRHFTSKIRDMTELKELGGRYLGFRGEALASAAELVGGLEIVTRIDGEIAACKLFIGRTGQVLRQETTSHPTGTTVRVTKLFQNIPVRKEVALKNALRTLNEIRQLLQKYALARPTVRLSLKVLKAKNDKSNWIYAPAKNATVSDAALNIFGMVESQDDVDILSSSNENPFHFEAFLPRSIAEPSLISNKGHFVLVDSRPVSCAKGTLKQVLSLYKDYIRSALSDTASTKIKDPLICMNIICPPASYDPNVEAAKDDVLFENQSLLLDSVGVFFTRIYGPLKKEEPQINTGKNKAARKTNAFELLLARRRLEADVKKDSPQVADSHRNIKDLVSGQDEGQRMDFNGSTLPDRSLDLSMTRSIPAPGGEQASEDKLFFEEGRNSEEQPIWRSTMYNIDDDDFDEFARDVAVEKSTKDQQMNPAMSERISTTQQQTTGPQMNSPPPSSISNSSPTKLPMSGSSLRSFLPSLLPSSGKQEEQPGDCARSQSITIPPTPSSSDHFSLVDPRAKLLPQEQPFNRVRRNSLETHSNQYQRSDLTIIGSEQSLPSDTNLSDGDTLQGHRVIPAHTEAGRRHHGNSFVTARSLPLNGAFDSSSIMQRPAHSEQSSRQRKGNALAEPIPPVRDMSQTWVNIGGKGKSNMHRKAQNMDIREALALTTSNHSGNRNPVEEPNEIFKSSSSTVSVIPDIEELLDYERRKKLATEQRRREKLSQRAVVSGFPSRQNDTLTITNSPHRNRYDAAIAALHDSAQTSEAASTSTFSSADPRAYFIRTMSHTNRGDGQDSMRRPKVSMLPLETVPESFRLQNVTFKLQTNLSWVEERLQRKRFSDRHVNDDGVSNDVFTTDESTPELQRRVSMLVNTLYRQESGAMLPNLTLDLAKSFGERLAAASSSLSSSPKGMTHW